MNYSFIFLWMIFNHVFDDYFLQGCLATLKQKSSWKEYSKFYQNDYIMALLMHSFSWTFMITLPIMFFMNFNLSGYFIFHFILNLLIHAFVDHLKANVKLINLVQDQIIHLMQICLLFILFVVLSI